MTNVDSFYPLSKTIQDCPGGMWQIGMVIKIEEHLTAAQAGDRVRESKLINRLGQIRRNVSSFNILNDNLKEVIVKSSIWLRSVGRNVDFKNEDPCYWITARDGKSPRW